jgi:hypothetical protein
MTVQSPRLSIKQTFLLLLVAFVLEAPFFAVVFLFSFGILHLSAQVVGIVGLVDMAVSLTVVMLLYRKWTKAG